MKKVLLTLTAVAGLTIAANAQTEKGKIMVGGQVGFETSKVKDTDYKNNSFSINPTVGYFVSDNWAVGTGIGYNWSKNESDKENSVKVDAFQVAPFVRKYSANGPLRFFAQLSVPMSWGKNTVEKANVESESKFENYGVELAPGLAYFPTNKIGIELKVRGLYYNYNKNKTADISTNTFGLDANSLAPTLGVQFHF
ncbi:outer membrane beta-barrel protein [Sphingobacterium thalpophilum]|uniref:Autotransporter beta-domain n=1 Tax=Sphingobacterium thalpophilum TaxID=259 RepID=A0A4U9W385_9SPHI|nr:MULTISPECIES: outer membrane beta-barrel protein [Sphingobacterium]MCW8311702.1 porin family protein [Sphingobacterium sp. InxBP1]VTR53147.1 Autotransporter beta-domain [Sphingobacterium thalpophilum]